MTQRTLIIDHVGHPSELNSSRSTSGLRRFDALNNAADEVWFLGGMDSLASSSDPSAGLLAGTRDRELLFVSQVKNASASQSNFDFLVQALPRFLQQLQPSVIELYSLNLLGVELLRVLRTQCPSATISVQFDDAQLACPLNGVFINIDGVRCHAPSPKACAYCMPALSPADVFYRGQYIRNHLGLIDTVQLDESAQSEQLITWLKPDFAGRINRRSAPKTGAAARMQGQGIACFSASNDSAGLRVLKRAVQMAREHHGVRFSSVDVFPTDASSNWSDELVDGLEAHGIQVQLKWAPHYFDSYMGNYGWSLIAGTPTADSARWLEQARQLGLQVIADESYPGADVRYAPHSAASLAKALAGLGQSEAITAGKA